MREVDYKNVLSKRRVRKIFFESKKEYDYSKDISKINMIVTALMLFVLMLIYVLFAFDSSITRAIVFVGFSMSYVILKEIYKVIEEIKNERN